MKKTLIIFTILAIVVTTASAHSGKTDSSGDHYNHSNGQYHYHHGYPAHQHTNGACPYDFDDQTNHVSSGSNTLIAVSPTPQPTVEPTTEPTTEPTSTQNNVSVVGSVILILLVAFSIVTGIIAKKKTNNIIPEVLPVKKKHTTPVLLIPELKHGGIPDGISLDDD